MACMQDLSSANEAGASVPCSASTEPCPLDHQRNPQSLLSGRRNKDEETHQHNESPSFQEQIPPLMSCKPAL